MSFEEVEKKKINLSSATGSDLLRLGQNLEEIDKDLYIEYYSILCEEALAHMKVKDSEYYNREYSGTYFDESNDMTYLLDKNNVRTSITPEQALGQAKGTEDVYRTALRNFLAKHPEKSEEMGITF